MQKIIYPLRSLKNGLWTAGDSSERPYDSCSTLTNYLWAFNRWKRKSGSARYNNLAFCEVGAENIAQWRLNDNLGDTDVIDSSGNAHTGTCSVNTSTAHATPKVGTGSFDFNGDRYITVADADDLSFGNSTTDSAFSLAAWIYVETGMFQEIVSKLDLTTGSELREWYLALNDGRPAFSLWDESASVQAYAMAVDALSAGWHHIVGTYDGGGGDTAADGITIYVDGSAVDVIAYNDDNYVAMEDTAADVMVSGLIGTDGNPATFVVGELDDVRVFNAELTVAEVTFIYNAGRGIESLLGEGEVRGGLTFNDGTINCILAFCEGSGYKTTGGGSMGSALTEPDASVVTWANADLDVFGAQIRDRLYLHNGDTTDPPLVFDGTYLIDMDKHTTGTADSGSTTTLVDDALTETTTDYWTGQHLEVTDAGDSTVYRGYVTDFNTTTDTLTFSPARDAAIVASDTYKIGVDGQEERNGKFTILHKNRIFNVVGSLLYYTVPYFPDWWGPEDGYVTLKKPGWKDGEDITALATLDDYIIVFKPHNIYAIRTVGKHYMWQVKKIVGTDSNKGCVWHRTLQRGFGGLIYHSWDGVYVLDRSLNVHCVSRNIEPTIKALAQSVSNPGGMSSVTKIDYTKVHFELGETQTKIDTATVSGTFRVDKTTEAIDQSQTTRSGAASTEHTTAQSFETSIDCIGTKVSLLIKKHIDPTVDLTVYLKTDNDNSPGATITSKTVARGDIASDDYYWVDFNWSDQNLAGSTRYWIYIPVTMSTVGTVEHFYYWAYNSAGGYADGNYWRNGSHKTAYDFCFKVYEQHYEPTSEFISQIHNLGGVPTVWRPFIATETLNGCSIAWYFRADSDSGMGGSPAWHAVENGGIPDETLAQYTQYRAVPTPTGTATPVVDDVHIQAYLGSAVNAPCAFVWDKAYWLSVQDTSSTVNSCIYVLDEEALMYEQHERWSKLEGVYINEFFIFNDQLMGTSVGGTGKGGFLYYLDMGTKDLGVDFTTTLITQKLDFSNLDPTYRDREKVYKKMLSKYVSQQPANLFYKTGANSWSSAIVLSAQPNVGIEEDFFVGLNRDFYLTLKVTQAVADPSWEWHSVDILGKVAKLRG